MSLSSGLRLGPYEIVSELGKGGMGVVYRAKDVRLNRDVAIKVLPEHLVNNPDALRRFEREAKALAALSHPNILSIFDVGTDQGISYVVMELLEGETLRSRIPASGLPWQKALDIAATIAEALSVAHSKGVVHRDLKPENIFLTSEDQIKIVDFGLARLTEILSQQETTGAPTRSQELESATISGTMPYMSPEQITGKGVDARSDIFSFGCVLYEMLTGRRTFSRNSSAETIAAILKENPQPLSDSGKQIPPQFERLLLHCLEKNPSRRFQTAKDLTFALREISNASLVPKTTYNLQSRKLKLVFTIAILAVLAGVSFFYFFTKPNKTIDSLAILPFANTGG
ncbi:serine/threonine protein kinase [bacterium]|nr:serine/threonine protein kinase [bacterium]